MKFLKLALAATVVSAFSASANAQDSNVYINAGVQTFEFDTYNILGRVGYNFNEYFGVEGEASIGISGDEVDGIDVDTPYSFGGYLTGRYPVSDQFDLFARVGYNVVNVEIDNGFDEADEDFDGFAIGGGVQYNFDDVNGVRLGYTYNDGGDLEADVIDLVYVRKF